MKAKYFNRFSTVENVTGFDAIVLESTNETLVPVRNPNLNTQLAAARKFNLPVLSRVVIQAQWYCAGTNGMKDTAGLNAKANIWTIKDMSFALGNPARFDGWIITAARDEEEGTTSAWVYFMMEFIALKAYGLWKIPHWLEFSKDQLADMQFDAQGIGAVLRDKQDGEFVTRTAANTTLDNGFIYTFSNELYNILQFEGSTPIDPEEPPIDPEEPPIEPDPEDHIALQSIANALEDIAASLRQITGRA